MKEGIVSIKHIYFNNQFILKKYEFANFLGVCTLHKSLAYVSTEEFIQVPTHRI